MSEEILEVVNDVLDLECDYKKLDTDDDGSFEGYGSVFNNKDLGNDVIKYGAFSESIKSKKPRQIKQSSPRNPNKLNCCISIKQMSRLV